MDELSGRVGPYTWRRDPQRSSVVVVTRDHSTYGTSYGGFDVTDVEKSLHRLWAEEQAVAHALATDPTELCDLGWHRKGQGAYFKWMGSGRPGVRLNYWMGREPAEWTATKIASIGPQAVPLVCSVCGQAVPGDDDV